MELTEAANVLCDEMGQRPDVESVEATPIASHVLEFLGHGEAL